MKRLTALLLVLAICLPLLGCGQTQYTLSDGAYRTSFDPGVCIIFDHEEQKFYYNYKQTVVAINDMVGTFEVDGNYVTCTAGDYTVVFKITNDSTIRFIQSKSSVLENSVVTDGMKFTFDDQE